MVTGSGTSHAAKKSTRLKSRRTGVTVVKLENHSFPLRISSVRIFGSTKSIVVATGAPVIFFNIWYGALLLLGECVLIRNPNGMGSNCLAFSWILVLLRQNQDWWTNGPCAGSISPIIPWSTCDGRSQAKCVLLYFSLNVASFGAAGKVPATSVPG